MEIKSSKICKIKESKMLRSESLGPKKQKLSQGEIDKTSRKVETTGCSKGNARGFSPILTHTPRMEEIMEEIMFNGKEKIEEVSENKKEQYRREINKTIRWDRHNT
jgi:hypothetical protein